MSTEQQDKAYVEELGERVYSLEERMDSVYEIVGDIQALLKEMLETIAAGGKSNV